MRKLILADEAAVLAYCFSRLPDAAFAGEDPQEDLGDLLSATHATIPMQPTKED